MKKTSRKEETYLYLKLVKDITNGIRTGVYLPGSKLPSNNELAREYGIHRLTVRRALRDLVRDGLIYTRPARGVYVKEAGSRSVPASDGVQNWSVGIVNDIVEPALFGYFHFEIIERIRNQLQRDGHALQILPSRGGSPIAQWISVIRKSELNGLILLGPMQAPFVAEFVRLKPLIHLDPQSSTAGTTTVCIDNEAGGYLAVRHLIELGHTSIALVTGEGQECSEERLAGSHRAAAELGRGRVKLSLFPGNFSGVSGTAAAKAILKERRRPTAAFCFNDEMAFGVLQTFAAESISVPRDISLVGFDDVAVASVVSPPLTTIRVSTADLASLAVLAIAHKLSGDQGNEVRHTVVPKLIVRQSTAQRR